MASTLGLYGFRVLIRAVGFRLKVKIRDRGLEQLQCEQPRPSSNKASKIRDCRVYLPFVSREWKNGSNSSYNCTPFLHSLLTKGKFRGLVLRVQEIGV